MRDRALIPCPAQGRRTLAAVPREQSFGLLELLLPLPGAVALSRLSQTHEELGRVRLLGGVDLAFELLTQAARVGFHPAHYRPTASPLLPCPAVLKKRHRLGLSDSPTEVESGLLMAARVKLPPQLPQEGRHRGEHRPGAMDPGMAARTERDHQIQPRSSRPAMMDHDRSLVPSGGAAAPAGVAIPLQNPFPETAEVALVLPPKRVAGGAVAIGDDLLPAAPAVKRPLSSLLHRLNTS